MISWGLVIAGCALIAGLGSYADKYFISNARRDGARTTLISLYELIERTHISDFVLILTRALSGWVATVFYFILSSIFIMVYMYLLFNDIAHELSSDPLPLPFSRYFNPSYFSHPAQLIILLWLYMSISTFVVTWAVRQIPNASLLKRRFNSFPFFLLIVYFFTLIYADLQADAISSWLQSALASGNKLLILAGVLLFTSPRYLIL
jgi:hypothetical protein